MIYNELYNNFLLNEYKNIKTISKANATQFFTFYKTLLKQIVLKLTVIRCLKYFEEADPAVTDYRKKINTFYLKYFQYYS